MTSVALRVFALTFPIALLFFIRGANPALATSITTILVLHGAFNAILWVGSGVTLITRRNAMGLLIGPMLGLLAFLANILVAAFTTDVFLAAVLLSVNSQFDPYFRSRGNLKVANIIALKINFFLYLLLAYFELLDPLSALFLCFALPAICLYHHLWRHRREYSFSLKSDDGRIYLTSVANYSVANIDNLTMVSFFSGWATDYYLLTRLIRLPDVVFAALTHVFSAGISRKSEERVREDFTDLKKKNLTLSLLWFVFCSCVWLFASVLHPSALAGYPVDVTAVVILLIVAGVIQNIYSGLGYTLSRLGQETLVVGIAIVAATVTASGCAIAVFTDSIILVPIAYLSGAVAKTTQSAIVWRRNNEYFRNITG